MSLAAELICSGFARTLRFYTDVLGFTTMRYLPERRRAELERDGVSIEIIERASTGVAPLEYPFGRGLTLVVWTHDVDAVYSSVQAYGARLHTPLQEVFTEEEASRTGHLAFEVLDPDGYAVRFCQALPPQRARG
jgi:catechol 2,3-dioxygenase-like lactoylglutathione lyase family enzyme